MIKEEIDELRALVNDQVQLIKIQQGTINALRTELESFVQYAYYCKRGLPVMLTELTHVRNPQDWEPLYERKVK